MGICTATIGIASREKIKKYIIDYITEHGYAPTFREIGKAVGLRSTSSVQAHVRRMINEGTLETDNTEGSPRALRVPGYRFCKVENGMEGDR